MVRWFDECGEGVIDRWLVGLQVRFMCGSSIDRWLAGSMDRWICGSMVPWIPADKSQRSPPYIGFVLPLPQDFTIIA